MKHLLICIALMALSLSHPVLGNCNPRDIKEQSSGKFLYPKDCHIEFGKLRKTENDRKKQIEHLNKSIELKDLAISKSNERIELWQNSTYKMEDRLLKIERNNNKLRWLYFGLGIAVMGGAVWGAGQLK